MCIRVIAVKKATYRGCIREHKQNEDYLHLISHVIHIRTLLNTEIARTTHKI